MQNDNQPSLAQTPQIVQPTLQQPVAYAQPIIVSPAQKASQNTLEYAMLVLAFVTLGSFMVGNGYLLKIGLIMVMVVAIASILRNLNGAKPGPTAPQIVSNNQAQPTKKPKSMVRLLGLTVLAIILLPVLGYAVMIAFFILLLMFGGGNMGT